MNATTPLAGQAQPATGGEALIDALLAHGVDTVFGLPGVQLYALFDALYARQSQIRTVGARHEQACGYMAFGYARSTGRPGVYAVVPGPGVLNTTAALCTAWGCNAPVLGVTGQVPSSFLGRGRGHLHEIPDQLATLRTLTKWSTRVDRPADVPGQMNQAFVELLSGRRGPVTVEMPWDALARSEPVLPLRPAPPRPAPAPDDAAIDAAAQRLAQARRPVLFVGSGAQHAGSEILELAEYLDAPVVSFRGGRGIVSDDHPLSVTAYAAYLLTRDSDAFLGIGTRMELPYMRWAGFMTNLDRPVAPPHLVRIDIDPLEMQRLVPDVGIVADAAEGTRALLAVLRRQRMPKRDREVIAAGKARAAQDIQRVQPQMAFLEAIRAVLPRNGFFVEELCQAGFTAQYGFPIYEPRTFVSGGFQGTLGFGFPTALGVKVANPDRCVVSVCGDGGFMFAAQELATAVQYGINLVTIVFNNQSYGNVRRDQQQRFAGHVIGADLHNPDFVRLAEAFGMLGMRARTPPELRACLEKAFAADAPVLIEVPVPRDSESSPWEFLYPRGL